MEIISYWGERTPCWQFPLRKLRGNNVLGSVLYIKTLGQSGLEIVPDHKVG